MSGETSPAKTLTVARAIHPLTETPLPCGTNTVAYLAHYQITLGSVIEGAVNELLLALDGQPIDLVENLSQSLADLGVSLVPIPLAPNRGGYPPVNEAENRTWPMPDNAIQKARADEVLKRQIAGYIAIHGHHEAWTLVDYPCTQPDLDLTHKVFFCLSQAFLPNKLPLLLPQSTLPPSP